jgi:hypothetical protein
MVEFEIIDVIGLGVSVALFYQSIRLVRKRKESVFEFLLWIGFGTILFALSLGSFVNLIDLLNFFEGILSVVGFESGRIGLLVLANLALMMMLFYTYINTKSNRKLIYDLNQRVALSESENDNE